MKIPRWMNTSWNQIAGRNTNTFRYAYDTTLMTEIEVELKRLLMRGKEENEKDGLKLNIQETKIMASGPNTSWQTDEEKVETMEDLIFFSKITVDGGCSHDGGGGGLVTKSCPILVTPWAVASQPLLFMRFCRHEY